jgi:hypothetical protein
MRALSREHYYMNTILIFIVIDAVIWLLALGWFVLEVYRAPEGWEDERGFHFGRKGVSTDLRASTEIHRSSLPVLLLCAALCTATIRQIESSDPVSRVW